MKRIPLTLLVILCYLIGMTQTPQTISYQGVLYNASGQLLEDASYTVTFKLYDGASSRSALWTESQRLATSEGVFSATLGALNPIRLPFDKPYWLGVQVGTQAELIPRINLTSVPYSFRARSVDKNSILANNIQAAQVVKSINGFRDSIRLVAGKNISLTASKGSITVNAVLPPPATPFPTGDNLLFPTGYAEEFISIDPEKLTLGGKPANVFEVPQGMDVRVVGNYPAFPPKSPTSKLVVGYVGTLTGAPSPGGTFECPTTNIASTVPRPLCDFTYDVRDGLVVPSLVNAAKKPLKRYVQFYAKTTGARTPLTVCSDPRIVCPTVTAVLVPSIKNLVLVAYRPVGRYDNSQLIKYKVPAGFKFVVNQISQGDDWRVTVRTALPYISINGGAPMNPTLLPIPYIFKSGTEIALMRRPPSGTKEDQLALSALVIQGFLKPN